MNFIEWWKEYNREQIFYKNYSRDTSMAIKALAEEAFNAGRDAWREVVSRDTISVGCTCPFREKIIDGDYLICSNCGNRAHIKNV